MRKLISIILLSIFIYNIFGYFIVFHSSLYGVRRNMKMLASQMLPDERFEIIKLTPGNRLKIKWIEKSEIIFNGKLYDVFKSKKVDGITYLYCINDKSEEQLFADLKKQVDNNSGTNAPVNQKAKSLLRLIPQFALLNSSLFVFHCPLLIVNYPFFILNKSLFIPSCPTPPPELI